jgi:hypothetical protein
MAVTTYQLNTNPSNGNLTGFNASTGSVIYTPNTGFLGLDSFTYNILCDGIIVDTATVTVDVLCIPVSGGIINGSTYATIGVDETFTISGVTGLPPFTFNHVVGNGIIVSGQGTNTLVVTPTGTPLSINTTISNCSGNEDTTIARTIPVNVGCTPTVGIKFNCFSPANIVGTIQGAIEPNRVISWTTTSIKFQAEVGTRNYEFTITDTAGEQHTVVLKNIHC